MNQLRKRILALVKRGALTEAVTAAADFVRRNPGMAEGYGLLSQTEEIAGYTKAAIKTVSHAIELSPHEPAYRFQRGRLHLKVNATAEALADMNSVIEMEQSSGSCHYTGEAAACRDEAWGRLQSRSAAASSSNPIVRSKYA